LKRRYDKYFENENDNHESYHRKNRRYEQLFSSYPRYNKHYASRSELNIDSRKVNRRIHYSYPNKPSCTCILLYSHSERVNNASRCQGLEHRPKLSNINNKYNRVQTPSCRRYVDLPLEFWERSDDCLNAKRAHLERIDSLCDSRETLVRLTTLANADTVLEKNMFPYDTPKGISHFTLWSLYDLTHDQIVSFVDHHIATHYPHVKRWQYDDNAGDRSVQLFHVHVYIEFIPYSFTPHPDKLYVPEHVKCHKLSVKHV